MIRKRVALLDPQKIGVGMSVFVAVRTDQHNADWLQNFATMISDMPEVVEFYRMSGEVDYLLRVVVADMAPTTPFTATLIGKVQLTDVSSSFAMEEIKFTTALPVDGAWRTSAAYRRDKAGSLVRQDISASGWCGSTPHTCTWCHSA